MLNVPALHILKPVLEYLAQISNSTISAEGKRIFLNIPDGAIPTADEDKNIKKTTVHSRHINSRIFVQADVISLFFIDIVGTGVLGRVCALV